MSLVITLILLQTTDLIRLRKFQNSMRVYAALRKPKEQSWKILTVV